MQPSWRRIKMNILYVLHSLDMGGAQKITVETAIAMKRRGHNVYLASPAGVLGEPLAKENIEYFNINISAKRKTPASFLINFFTLLSIVLKYKIDIIHTIHRWPNFICFFVRMISGIKLIWTDHNILTGKRLITLCGDRAISVSDAGKRHLSEYFHIPNNKITVIRNAIKPPRQPDDKEIRSFLDEIGYKSGEKIVCTVANLVEQKGHEYLLRAIPAVLPKISKVRFVFAGDGPLREGLVKLSDELGISKYVNFLGQREDVPVIFASSDIMVLPSLWEGLPLVILESFSFGKPVIVTDVGGNRELVLEGETGLVVKARDAKGLSDSIIRILTDDPKRREMGIKAKELADNKFDFDKMISQIESVYSQVLKKDPY